MLKVNVRDTWTPTADEFWNRPSISKAWVAENTPEEIAGGIRLLSSDKIKKAERVATLHKWFQNPEDMRMTDIGLKQDKPLEAKRVKAITAWTPPGMAFQPPPMPAPSVEEDDDSDSDNDGQDVEQVVSLAS